MRTHADTQQNCPAEVTPDVTPKAPWRVAEVRALPGYRLWVRFNDGLEGTVVMADFLHSDRAGVFAVLRDEDLFAQVSLRLGAVIWPGDLDLAPDAMHEGIRRDEEWRVKPP